MITELEFYEATWDDGQEALMLSINGTYATYLDQHNITDFLDCLEVCSTSDDHGLIVQPVLKCYYLKPLAALRDYAPNDIDLTRGSSLRSLTAEARDWQMFRYWLYSLGYLDWIVF